VNDLEEKRKGEIALAAKKIDIRKELSFRDIPNIGRNAGNLAKEKEMIAINATAEEITELALLLVDEVYQGLGKKVS
jgi:hypothetical protein